MNIDVGNKVLITCDQWFYAPDGELYRGVYGTLKGAYSTEETLGIKTNNKSTNWYVEIGNVTIAGCQIHYAIKCDMVGSRAPVKWNSSTTEGLVKHDNSCLNSEIYITD